jgi:hypothetical protein
MERVLSPQFRFEGPVDAEMIGNRIYVVSTDESRIWRLHTGSREQTRKLLLLE